ncbi:macrolide family glycosyltransferase [Streptomyces sp. NPDC020965]|uniref:macrolide family glycosyltransferase n=1 Tax=Streptomyces sp. NPDC020965 TaxID=3365105 RepID=UPI003792D2E7
MNGRSGQNRAPHRRGHVGVFTFPAYAHIAPALPTLAELVRRGHRVTCCVAERFADMVRAVGADPVVYESTFPWAAGPTGSALEGMLHFFEEGHAPLRAAVAAFADDRPDVLAHDLAASESARLLARSWDIPVVQMCCTIASSPKFSMTERQAREAPEPPPGEETIDAAHPAITRFVASRDRLLAECGLTDVSIDGFGAEHGDNIVFLPKEFQIAPETFDDRFAFIGPCPEAVAEPAPGTGWSPPASGRPVLLLSLGSSYTPDQGAFLRSCVAALADSPWHVVTTLSHRVRPEELGPLPPNVEAHQWLRHPEVLRHAAAFVTHSGMGSVMEALAFGVPMVLVPYHIEQRVIAARATELDLGRVLHREAITPTALRTAVHEVSTSPRIHAAVATMRRHVHEAGGAARGADVVESLLRTGPATHPPTTRDLRK